MDKRRQCLLPEAECIECIGEKIKTHDKKIYVGLFGLILFVLIGYVWYSGFWSGPRESVRGLCPWWGVCFVSSLEF